MVSKRCPGRAKDNLTDHQSHYDYFSCEDVISMEKAHGKHEEGCVHTGYISAKACGCREAGDRKRASERVKEGTGIREKGKGTVSRKITR